MLSSAGQLALNACSMGASTALWSEINPRLFRHLPDAVPRRAMWNDCGYTLVNCLVVPAPVAGKRRVVSHLGPHRSKSRLQMYSPWLHIHSRSPRQRSVQCTHVGLQNHIFNTSGAFAQQVISSASYTVLDRACRLSTNHASFSMNTTGACEVRPSVVLIHIVIL